MPLLVTLLYVIAALLGASFALAEFRLLARFLANRDAVRATMQDRRSGVPRGDAERPPPTVTIQLPMYNERASARRAILAAAAQDYPTDRFDIQVLDDSTDETTAIVAASVDEAKARGVRIEHIHRTHRVGYKAGALAEGLRRSSAEFVAVFDADFLPGPDFLTRVVLEDDGFQDPDVAFVQARWSVGHSVRGMLHSALSMLLDRHFYVQKPTRVFAGQVTTFNGSGGVWRRAAIDSAGGWSADTLTEDLDLSYRCALSGWRGAYLHETSVPNELPGDMRAFKLQQLRWARGNAQCFRKLARSVLDSKNGLRDRWEEAFLLAGYGIHPILLLNLLLWPWAVLYVDRVFFWVMQAVMSLATLAAPASFLITLRERGDRLTLRSLGHLLAGLLVGMGLMVNNTLGQVQGFLLGQGAFARTPKGWRRSEGLSGAEARPYVLGLHWSFFVELGVTAYCLASIALLVARGETLWALPLAFWGGCIASVAHLQLVRTRGGGEHDSAWSERRMSEVSPPVVPPG